MSTDLEQFLPHLKSSAQYNAKMSERKRILDWVLQHKESMEFEDLVDVINNTQDGFCDD